MIDIAYFEGKYILMIISGLVGIFFYWVAQRILRKRGVFGYFVTHNKVGTSSTDPVFGNINVTWNDRPVGHLFSSTIELKNESLNDYENVVITAYTNDTFLLSEFTNIVDTPNILKWSENYGNQLYVEPGQEPTEHQFKLCASQREYLIPVFNRGQVVRISYLNESNSDAAPSIWLSATVKGVVLKFKVPQNQILGVPQPQAALAGAVFGFIGLVPLVLLVSNSWLAAMVALIYGFIAQLPGAYLVKGLRVLREAVGN